MDKEKVLQVIEEMKLELNKPIRFYHQPRLYVTLNIYYNYIMKFEPHQLCYITDKGYLIKNGKIIEEEL